MLGRAKFAGTMVIALLLTPAFAQGRWQRHPAPPQRQTQRSQPRQQNPGSNQPGHAGNWLRRYKDLPPDQQRKELEKDPQFRNLPPPRQQQLLHRLQRFSSLPPQQQEHILNRMETWEHLTREQKQDARQLFQQFRELPQERRQAVNHAIRSMRDLTPEQREQLINSNQFSPQEQDILRGAARLPLAPGDGLQAEPPEE